jgi:hypothetical protein
MRALLLAVLLTACGGAADTPDTPRSDVPAPLAGAWYTGTLSTIQYYDDTTGEWLDPSGEGFYWILDADGGYETGAVINSTVAGCTMRLLGQEVGTVTLDDARITVYRHRVTTHVTNSCGSSGDRTQGQETRAMSWTIQPDASGLEWLTFTHDDGSVEQYHRWEW